MNHRDNVFSLVDRMVRRICDRWGHQWVVAVSGGSDSVALIRALHRIAAKRKLRLSVAHLDHGTRGEIGREEARFVAGLAESLGLPIDLGSWSPARSNHFEADARTARYAWLIQVAQNRGARVIAVGHTRDDQVETILHRIVRGTGPKGLTGIPKSRRLTPNVTLVRPLLEIGHADLKAYLRDLNQTWREDLTNLDTSRTRSRIRHNLLPELAREYNPNVAEALIRLARLTRAAVNEFDETVVASTQSVTRSRSLDRVVLDRAKLAGFSPYLRAEVLRKVWSLSGWSETSMDLSRWQRLAASVAGLDGMGDIGAGVRLAVIADRVELFREVTTIDECLDDRSIPLEIPGEALWLGHRIEATIDEAEARTSDPMTEWVDFDRLSPPLRVEAAKPGDRFEPLGMPEGQTTALADFFRGRKVAKIDRRLVPLVKDKVGIVWVVGHRICHRVRLTEATQKRVKLRWLV